MRQLSGICRLISNFPNFVVCLWWQNKVLIIDRLCYCKFNFIRSFTFFLFIILLKKSLHCLQTGWLTESGSRKTFTRSQKKSVLSCLLFFPYYPKILSKTYPQPKISAIMIFAKLSTPLKYVTIPSNFLQLLLFCKHPWTIKNTLRVPQFFDSSSKYHSFFFFFSFFLNTCCFMW